MNILQKIQIIIAVVLTVIAGGFWLLYANTAKTDNQPETVQEKGSYAVYFDPSEVTLEVNESTDVEIVINSDYIVSGIETVFTFDPTIISIENVETTEAFSLYLGEQIDNDQGIFTIAAANVQPYVMTDLTVVILSVVRRAEGETALILEQSLDNKENSTIILEKDTGELYSQTIDTASISFF